MGPPKSEGGPPPASAAWQSVWITGGLPPSPAAAPQTDPGPYPPPPAKVLGRSSSYAPRFQLVQNTFLPKSHPKDIPHSFILHLRQI